MNKKETKFPHYVRRKNNLTTLNYSSYYEYLKSDDWKRIRNLVLKRDNYKCRICKNRATQVHHKRYFQKVLTGKNIGYLVSICSDCHTFIEYDVDTKEKRGIGYANQIFNKLKKCLNKLNRNIEISEKEKKILRLRGFI